MKMAESDSITIKVGAENGNIHQFVQPQNKSQDESSSVVITNPVGDRYGCSDNGNITTDKNDKKKRKLVQPKNGTDEIIDLTNDNTPDDVSNSDITTGNCTTNNNNRSNSNISDSGNGNGNGNSNSNVLRSVIDFIPIAKKMWKFTDREANQELTDTYVKLPSPMYHTVTKTAIYHFQRRQALPDDNKEYSPNAQFYINLLKSHNQKLADEPFNLVSLKCAYCSIQPGHIPGSCSFIRISNSEEMPRLLADALHQRLLHLRNSCKNALHEHGAEVTSLFSNIYDREDLYLKQFVRMWLKQLDDGGKRQQQQQIVPPPAAVGTTVAPQPLPWTEERLRTLERATSHALDDRTMKYMNKSHESIQATTSAAIGPTSAFAQAHSLAMMTPELRQQAFVNYRNQHQHTQYAVLHHRLQHQQHQQQHLVENIIIYPSQYATSSQLAPHGRQLLLRQNHQQLIRQDQFVRGQEQQHRIQQIPPIQSIQQQMQKQQQQQQQQQQQKQHEQQQKPRQRPPQIFPRNKKVPFEELLQIYETGWEDTSWSVFNPPYDSDDDDDEADNYFCSIHENTNKTDTDSDRVQNVKKMSSYKMSLPPLPLPQKNLDYYLPVPSYELAQCPRGLPFLKDEETVSTPKKSRGRQREPSPVDVSLSDVKPDDVVMACDGCPTDLAKALHNLIGNRHFLRLVSVKRNDYTASSSDTERLIIVKTLIKKIKKRRGSFLKANTTKKKTSRTWKTSDKEAEDYTRFRLEQGFPDILNNPKIGKCTFRCSAPAMGSRSSTTPVRVAAKDLADLLAAISPAVEPSSRNDAHDATASTDPAMPATPTVALDVPLLPSKVFDVEHAPQVGLMNGFLEWNNSKSDNPVRKFSQFKILSPHTTKGSKTTAAVRANDEQGTSNVAINEQKKSEHGNTSQGEASTMEMASKKGGVHSGEIMIAIGQEQAKKSGMNGQCNDLNEPPEKKQEIRESNKRNCPESTSSEVSGSQPVKRSRSEVDLSGPPSTHAE
jgi:hypothetical protein